jgi:2-polyprenyl-3-methyl-5-hydroxy-6-metoxy-1,4-benzoquinol methylase
MGRMDSALICNLCDAHDEKVKYVSSPQSASSAQQDFHASTDCYGDFGRVVECRQCGLVYTSPRQDALALADGYAEVADVDYASEDSSRSINSYFCLNTLSRFVPAGRLLDVGCAAGYFLNAARLRYEVQGVELSRAAVAYARERLALNVFHGTLEAAALSDDSFDVVTLIDVIEHLDNPRQTLRDIWRILKPGGLLYIVTPDVSSNVARLLGSKWWGLRPAHVYYFSPKTLTALLNKTGFEPCLTQSYGRVFRCAYWFSRLRSYSGFLIRCLGYFIRRFKIQHKLVYLNTFDSIECCARKKSS